MTQAVECPKCSKKAVVQRSDNLYQCVACDFKRDLSKTNSTQFESDFFWSLTTLLLAILIALMII